MLHAKLPRTTVVTMQAVLAALLLTFVSACSSSPSGSGTGPTGQDGSTMDVTVAMESSTTCGAGLTSCNGSCVNVQTDPHNCSTCGATCGGGLVCASGQCSVSCPMGKTNCSGACSNTMTDFDNCGACGTTCMAGQVCNSGMCGNVCTAPTKNCGGSCVDETSDPSNCGACNNACGKGLVCSNSTCATSCGSLTTCVTDGGSFCTNTESDNLNCGTCGTVCSNGQICSSGKCQTTCQTGQVICNGSCIDPTTSTQFCGATTGCGSDGGSAGAVCPQGQSCVAGLCNTTCPTGEIGCGTNAGCVNPLSNNQFCGATLGCGVGDAGTAGADCTNGTVCSGGTCQATCGAGLILCSVSGTPTCIDPTSNGAFCGATTGCGASGKGSAGSVCANGNVCASGTCSPTCGGGQVLCDGTCVDPTTNPFWCGAVAPCNAGPNQGQICATGHVCSNGNCQLTCAPNQALCGSGASEACIDPTTSRQFCGAQVGSCNPIGKDCTSTALGFGPGWICAGAPPVCTLSCQAGLVDCTVGGVGGTQTCIDPTTDPSFCGATTGCGTTGGSGGFVCQPGFTCTPVGGVGHCVQTCLPAQALCNGVCVNPVTSPTNCGQCTTSSATDPNYQGQNCSLQTGFVCSGTTPANAACGLSCQTNLANCGGTCTDGLTSLTHCGAAGVVAGSPTNTTGQCTTGALSGTANYPGLDCTAGGTKTGFTCVAGACTLECALGLVRCGQAAGDPGGGTCIDPHTNATYCGASSDATGSCGVPNLVGGSTMSTAGATNGTSACPALTACNIAPGSTSYDCVDTCITGQKQCIPAAGGPAAYCANYTTDNNNCGGTLVPVTDLPPTVSQNVACQNINLQGNSDPGNGVCGPLSSCGLDSGTAGVVGAVYGCNSTCPNGETQCLNPEAGAPYCAQLTTDVNNCGSCYNVCPTNAPFCSTSTTGAPPVTTTQCKAACDTGLTTCYQGPAGSTKPTCVNTATDSNNCGGCGELADGTMQSQFKCAAGTTCIDSVCCATPANDVCAGACTNTVGNPLGDPKNCGPGPTTTQTGCAGNGGTACTTGDICARGNCCPGADNDYCEGTCTNTQTDFNNCGQCSSTTGYSACTGSNNACCSGGCVDELTDVNNCGSCGNKCTGGGSNFCSNGVCEGDITPISLATPPGQCTAYASSFTTVAQDFFVDSACSSGADNTAELNAVCVLAGYTKVATNSTFTVAVDEPALEMPASPTCATLVADTSYPVSTACQLMYNVVCSH